MATLVIVHATVAAARRDEDPAAAGSRTAPRRLTDSGRSRREPEA